jgi:hypothetical protein
MVRARVGGIGIEPAAQDGHAGMIGPGFGPAWRLAKLKGLRVSSGGEPPAGSNRPAPMPILLALITLLAVACSSPPALPAVPAVPVVSAGNGPLVTVTLRGGECPHGACGSVTVIGRDGVVRQTQPVAAELGTLPNEILAALQVAVNTADFDALRSHRFTGECPVNFDGQEFIYEFGAPGGVERIASCETEIDPGHPLFAAVEAALMASGSAVPPGE